MQHLEVSCAVRHIYVVSRLRVKTVDAIIGTVHVSVWFKSVERCPRSGVYFTMSRHWLFNKIKKRHFLFHPLVKRPKALNSRHFSTYISGFHNLSPQNRTHLVDSSLVHSLNAAVILSVCHIISAQKIIYTCLTTLHNSSN
jgi:hypothetical protein